MAAIWVAKFLVARDEQLLIDVGMLDLELIVFKRSNLFYVAAGPVGDDGVELGNAFGEVCDLLMKELDLLGFGEAGEETDLLLGSLKAFDRLAEGLSFSHEGGVDAG